MTDHRSPWDEEYEVLATLLDAPFSPRGGKNRDLRVRLIRRRLPGTMYVDIRLFDLDDATKQGVTLPMTEVEGLRAAIGEAIKQARSYDKERENE